MRQSETISSWLLSPMWPGFESQRILSHILRVECVEGSLHCSVERYFLLVFLFSPLHQKHCPMRESRTVLDSGFHAVDSGLYWIPVFVGRTWILHSNPIFVCGILHSLSVFRIPKVKFSQIPESGFLYMGRKSNISTDSNSIWSGRCLKFVGDLVCGTFKVSTAL